MTKEDTLLANLFLNLKGSKIKRDDWISIAKTCDDILSKSKNRQEAAKKLGVSQELIRSITSLLKLPREVQELIKNGHILFDAAQRLNTIKLNDKNAERLRQIEVARAISGLPSHKQREIIHFAKRFPNSSISDFKKRVISPREVRNLHVIVLTVEDDAYKILQKVAKRKRLSVEKSVLEIVDEWLEGHQK